MVHYAKPWASIVHHLDNPLHGDDVWYTPASSRDSLPPAPTPGRWGCFPLPSKRGSRTIPPRGCIPVSRGITPCSSPKPAWGSISRGGISRGGIPGCCIPASSTRTTTPAGRCCIPCWGITRCNTNNHCQGNSKLQHALKHLHNVETHLYGPQAFLKADFHCRMMFS